MRWTMAISVALLLTLGAYAGSAAVSLHGLVQAVQSKDAAAVMSRTDLPRLKRSLIDQIVAAYLNRIGQKRAVKPLERLAANTYGASIADVMVGKLLTQERLTELLNSGKVSLDASYLGEMGQLSRVVPSKLLETAKRIRLVNPAEFSLQLGSGQDAGAISLHFEGDGWKLSGIQLPSAVLDALSRHLPAQG
jgi:Protein of unknown function (DUF2939)